MHFLTLLIVLSLTGCASVSNYRHQRPVVCASVSAVVVASLVMTLSGGDDDETPANERPVLGVGYGESGTGVAYPTSSIFSDARLKRDIQYAETLPNGIRLHTFRYWNDPRVFVGVLAQELLQDARYRHAVHQTGKGYYRVNLTALGLRMNGKAGQYLEAGEAALRAAAPL